jgi:hypothetical protein
VAFPKAAQRGERRYDEYYFHWGAEANLARKRVSSQSCYTPNHFNTHIRTAACILGIFDDD